MKVVEKFLDEISNRVFDTREEAIKSEIKHGGIKNLFSFWEEHSIGFPGSFQRTEIEFLLLKHAFVKAIIDYEPWIASHYEKDGGFRVEHVWAGAIVGRFLDDNHSPLYHWYGIISKICPVCFKEKDQQYYATHCDHS